jgi:hypothetical protein
VTVSTGGLVTAVGEGVATVQATYQSMSGSDQVTIVSQ